MDIVVKNPTTGNVYVKYSLPNFDPTTVSIVSDGKDKQHVVINADPIESLGDLQERFNNAQYL
jgi:hypothetical protein